MTYKICDLCKTPIKGPQCFYLEFGEQVTLDGSRELLPKDRKDLCRDCYRNAIVKVLP